MIGMGVNEKHLVATLSTVCCLGLYRRPQVVAAVLRENKVAAAVRSFLCIYKLRKFAADAGKAPISSNRQKLDYSQLFTDAELKEVSKTFDAFDRDGSGVITAAELRELMQSLGATTSDATLESIMRRLDSDGSGQITRAEFLQWYVDTMQEPDSFTLEEKAEFLFSIFDHDKSGEITLSEFKARLDALKVGLSPDDYSFLVNELDHDNNGSIGKEEFVHLLNQYYPRELKESIESRSMRGTRARPSYGSINS
jgi:Ca2+-binding EF-hand superfamily protein